MNKKAKLILQSLLSAFLILFLYILFHECGHMVVMLSAGATITDFSIIGAHVSSEGGNYTNYSNLWFNANGALLPLLLSYVYILFYRENSKNTFYRLFSWFVFLVPASSMIAWVIIPFTYLQGNAPANDDVTKFLFNYSQSYHPLIVSTVATLLIGISILLIIKKKVLRGFVDVIKDAR